MSSTKPSPSPAVMTAAGFARLASRGRWSCPPHLALLNRKLMLAASGRIRRLLITMPPRHGKSELTSKYFPAWFLGTFPDRRVILASYEADFAQSWGRKVRDLLKEFGPSVFGVDVRRDSTAANRWSIAGDSGGMDTAGVGGALTGKGAHLLIIDDPVKNAAEANSPTYRERAWDWWVTTVKTRIEPGGIVVLIQTRWHEQDLAGKVIASALRTGQAWDIVNLPALAEEGDILGRKPGEALWPERYPVEELHDIRDNERDPAALFVRHWFDALYQQRPLPAEGGQFKRGWFRYWEFDGDGEFYRLGREPSALVRAADCRRFGVVDLAFSTRREADFTVLGAFAVGPASDLILLDLQRERMEGPGIIPALRRMIAKHDLAYIAIEENGAQIAVVQAARVAGITVRPLRAETDKITRAIVATVRMEGETVFFPRHAPWLADFEGELLSFPRGAHDDQVDVLAYAALEVQRFGGAAEPDEIAEAREAEARAAAEAAYHDVDNEEWWGH